MKRYPMRKLCLLLTAVCILLTACSNENIDGNPAETTLPQSDSVTEAQEPPAEPEQEGILQLTWNLGYVGSASNVLSPNQLVPSGDRHSYTDVFVIPKAGTTITFSDDNTNDNGDGRYTSKDVYVISSWKQERNDWVLDTAGANYAGSVTTLSDILVSYEGGVVTYSYTTSLENEALRLCYRSGQSVYFTPPVYPEVKAIYTGAAGTAISGEGALKRWIENSKNDFYGTVLQGLNISAIGDSYFGGQTLEKEYIWLNLLAQKYDAQMNNYGINGSTVSNLVSGNQPMCERYQKMTEKNVDIILVEGGRNDYNQSVPIGDVDSTDTKTYSGALNVIIDGLQEMYPNAMIVCITPWNFTGTKNVTYAGKTYKLTYKDYADAMEAVANAQGVYCIRACEPEISGIDMTDENFRAKYCLKPSDISHLNLEGMKIAMTHFEKILAKYYQDFKTK